MQRIVRIISQGQVTNVTKTDGTIIQKCNVVMRELGGQYENAYVATLFSPVIGQFQPNDVYAVSLRFQAHEHNGVVYQDVFLQDYSKLK